jgi:hypothetical protein
MDITSLVNVIAAAVASDPEIKTWCDVTYGQTHKVYKNADRRNPPGEDDCPFVILFPTGKTAGERRSRKNHRIEVDVCIHDDSTSFSDDIAGLISYAGVDRIEEFRKLVETAVETADTERCTVDDVDIEYNTVENFPFLWAGTVFNFGEPARVGADPLE